MSSRPSMAENLKDTTTTTTTTSTAATATGAGEQPGDRAVVDRLGHEVVTVLEVAAGVVNDVAADTVDGYTAVDLLDTLDGTRQLLGLLTDPGLRAAAAAGLGHSATDGSEESGLAGRLVAADAAVAERAVAEAGALLDDARRAARAERRRSARAARGSAEDRAQARAVDRLEEMRTDRDRARTRAETFAAEAASARTQAEQLEGDLVQVRHQLEATQHQLDAARAHSTDPHRAAQQLRDALNRDPADLDDLTGPAPDVATAAAAAGLPADVAADAGTWLPRLLTALATPPRPVSVTDLDVSVDVLGGGSEIGGSCVLVSAGGTRLLIDCGARPNGTSETTMAPPDLDRALAGHIDAIVITHAHHDHAGWVPVVLAQRPGTPVYATAATADLLATMWTDSAKVLSRRVQARDGWTGGPVPPYGYAEVNRALDAITETSFGRRTRVGAAELELFPAGHIVGAAGVVVHAGDRRVVVTGDVSRPGQKTVGGIVLPPSARDADVFLIESTYAGSHRDHKPRMQVVKEFLRDVERTVERGGVALVPSFALGRAQEVALLCGEYLSEVDVVVDGLARSVTEVYERHPGPKGTRPRVFTGRVRKADPRAADTQPGRFGPGVVIATSGMLTAGPAVTWARRVLPDPASSLMVVGYQDEESPGARLLRLQGGGAFTLPGDARTGGMPEDVDVLAQVGHYQLGAHAGADELAQIVAEAAPRTVMLVHGEPTGQAEFAGRLRTRGHATTPAGLWRPDR